MDAELTHSAKIGHIEMTCPKCKGTLSVTVPYMLWVKVKVWGAKDVLGTCLHCGRRTAVRIG